jgi:hypothetical protein
MKVVVTILVLSIVAVACTGSEHHERPPVVIHAKQPDRLYQDWGVDAVMAAWDAACPKGDREGGSQSWSTHYAHPSPNAKGTDVVPDKIGGMVTCSDGSRHEVVIVFDQS